MGSHGQDFYWWWNIHEQAAVVALSTAPHRLKPVLLKSSGTVGCASSAEAEKVGPAPFLRQGNGRRRPLQKLDEFGLPGGFEEVEAREGDREMEAFGTGAAGIDVEDTVAPVGVGFVGVAGDDDLEAGGFWVEVEVPEVVKDVDRGSGELDDFGKRECFGPRCGVDVPANGVDGSNGSELVEHGGIADVAGVHDGVGAFQSRHSFRTEEAVGVGDDAEEERVHRA